jgi:tRNA (mo5U34)-methyltransferase
MKASNCMARPPRRNDVPAAARALSPWFHNLHLPNDRQTAPDHPLGDFPACKWKTIAGQLPADLTGWTALDVGCNAGFYSIELARRGARVTAIDREPHFLRQAQWAVRQFNLGNKIELRQMQVYDLAHVDQQFDLVLMMGLFYHLRYPLLGLDIVAEKAQRLFLFQTLTLPGERIFEPADDYPIHQREQMRRAGWPKMAFIEKSFAGDATNWWAPNHACVEAMLRSTGMRKIRRVSHEIYLCQPSARTRSRRLSAVAAELQAAVRHSTRRKGRSENSSAKRSN